MAKLSSWDSIWSIVGGIVATVIFVGVCMRWLWRWLHRPRLVIECGDSAEFQRQLTADPTTDALAASLGGEVVGVRAKILKVRETRGTIARGVAARITSVDPANPYAHHLPEPLEWTTHTEEITIQPRGQRVLILQLVIALKVRDKHSYVVRPAVLEDSPSEFTLELLVDGERHNEWRFQIEDTWPGLRLLADSEPVIPDPFPKGYSCFSLNCAPVARQSLRGRSRTERFERERFALAARFAPSPTPLDRLPKLRVTAPEVDVGNLSRVRFPRLHLWLDDAAVQRTAVWCVHLREIRSRRIVQLERWKGSAK
jgi:hypothetical protein